MIHIICNMCSHDLPDMYTLSPWACGPRASGIHIRQIPRAHVTTITYNTYSNTIHKNASRVFRLPKYVAILTKGATCEPSKLIHNNYRGQVHNSTLFIVQLTNLLLHHAI